MPAETKIDVDADGAVTGVQLADGRCLVTGKCIFSPHPKLLPCLLPGKAFRPAYRHRLQQLRDTSSGFVLYVTTPGASPPKGNVIVAPNPAAMLAPEIGGALEDRPIFIGAPQTQDGGITVICSASLEDVAQWIDSTPGTRPASYNDWKQVTGARILEALERRLPDMLSTPKLLATATPLTFRDLTNTPGGGLYGAMHHLDDMPLLPITRVGGLYLTGQAVVAPGLVGALCSSFLTTRALVGPAELEKL